MSTQPILEATGLTAAYGQAQILFGVSLTLGPGEVVALMGRNGAGKSTTFKAIIGLVDAAADTLAFAGHDIRHLPTHRIARLGLGYVPEDRRIFTDLSVEENLQVGAKAPLGANAAAWTPERLFEIFPNLAEMRHRRASQMSGGEQQMLTIARTLMGNPTAMLLDEPSEGIAPVIVELMAESVRRMKAEGISVLLSEQNLYFASAVADRAYIIEKGAIRHEGRMADIVADTHLREQYLSV
ncbi:MAG: ABC transporter ATP-binding protein [Hyphomicrobiales bacterium]|nr:MAG: ABC transporter ATP-binding protein [Hyphomicrobiales bacterium]